MSTFALWRLFHRHMFHHDDEPDAPRDHTGLLAVIAFAAATAIFLTVLGGLHGFIWRASPDHTVGCFFNDSACSTHANVSVNGEFYVVLAMFACVLLVVPFTTLAGSAARLAATRRDERLAVLRLAGATTSQVVRLIALEAVGQAVIGSVLGIAGYFAVMPLIMMLHFENHTFDFEQLWGGAVGAHRHRRRRCRTGLGLRAAHVAQGGHHAIGGHRPPRRRNARQMARGAVRRRPRVRFRHAQ
jgi:hypothetical protein